MLEDFIKEVKKLSIAELLKLENELILNYKYSNKQDKLKIVREVFFMNYSFFGGC